MNEIKTEIDQDLVNYIESLDYEVTARKDIIVFMLSNNMNVDTEAFINYQKEFNEFNAQLMIAKNELEKKYVPEGDHVWRLNYADRILTVTPKSGNACNCGK